MDLKTLCGFIIHDGTDVISFDRKGFALWARQLKTEFDLEKKEVELEIRELKLKIRELEFQLAMRKGEVRSTVALAAVAPEAKLPERAPAPEAIPPEPLPIFTSPSVAAMNDWLIKPVPTKAPSAFKRVAKENEIEQIEDIEVEPDLVRLGDPNGALFQEMSNLEGA